VRKNRHDLQFIVEDGNSGSCATACNLEMLSLCKMGRLDGQQVQRFSTRVELAVVEWG